MAKFNIEFDTMTKMLSVTKDGELIENVTDVTAFKSYEENGEYCIRLSQKSEDESSDITTYIMTSANDKTRVEKFDSSLEEAIARHYGV